MFEILIVSIEMQTQGEWYDEIIENFQCYQHVTFTCNVWESFDL